MSGNREGPGGLGIGGLARRTEQSVHGVQLVPGFTGTDEEGRHVSLGVMVLLSVLEAMSASTSLAGVESHIVRDWCFHLLVVHSTEETGASSEPAILQRIPLQSTEHISC